MKVSSKLPYNKLGECDRQIIIDTYYDKVNLMFDEISDMLNISRRAISRVLEEAGINTKRLNRYKLNESFFENIDNEQKAYILGLLYADGYVGDEHFNNIVLQLKDREIIEQIAKLLDFTGAIRKSKKGGFKNSKEGYVLNFSSEIMANSLRNIGLYPNKSLTLNNIPNMPESLLRHFIRGYFDGDGSIILSKHSSYHKVAGVIKKYEYPCYTFMILGTKEFIEKIVIIMHLNHYIITNTKTEEIKCLRVCAKCDANYLYNYLYDNSTIYLERKYSKWLEVLSAFMK
jgi:intein/homing endonuclease